ncbi:conserved exported protein of unknown function [Burkholderia multivorans]
MKRSLIALVLASAGIAASGIAHAVNVDVNIGTPAPVVVAPAPAAVVVAPGWHDNRYWDGHRYWERREWEMHERAHHHDHDRDFERRCPPGHIKNGKC